MNKQNSPEPAQSKGKIKIDYDNVDVADIMNQIKDRISAMPKKAAEKGDRIADYTPSVAPPEIPPEGDGSRSGMKSILLKIMRPFSPLIKLLILPVHHELTETVKKLDYANKKLDYWTEKLDRDLHRMNREPENQPRF
jgi:hypothetical protein